ncbi:MAG: adenylate kinase [Chloroflexi bacterium]|nr:adenylate kinase [Chloroflexota bacterium]
MAQEIESRRIVVVGTSGSGKTTCAQEIARRQGCPHIELDSLHWLPNWTPAPIESFRQQVTEALTAVTWVTDGNYSKVRDIVWGRADTLVWLDYPLPLIMWRLLRRGVRRVGRREPLWNGNQETWRGLFFSRDSLFLWALQTHQRHRREYPLLLTQPAYAHLRVHRLPTPRQTTRWLQETWGE